MNVKESKLIVPFLSALSITLFVGILVGSIIYARLYQNLSKERINLAARVADLSTNALQLSTSSTNIKSEELTVNEERQWKQFLNEGALGFSFNYPAEIYFDLSFIDRTWTDRTDDMGDTVLYGCFSKQLPPGPEGMGTEPFWCIGSVEVQKASLNSVLEEYERIPQRWIGMETMDGGKIEDVDIEMEEVVITSARIPSRKVILHVQKKGVIPDVPSEWDEISVEYLIERDGFVYILSNEGFGGNIDEEIFNQIVASVQFLRTTTLCTDPPIVTDIGSDVYPIDPKYDGLGFLGQLFTAYGCGPERVNKIFGVDGEHYTLGSALWLKENPSQQLINIFKSIGFQCEENVADLRCKRWELLDFSVKIDDLMKIEPYHTIFERDDCRNCG